MSKSQTQRSLALDENVSSCICLQDVVLGSIKYNLGTEYKFYATVPPGQ